MQKILMLELELELARKSLVLIKLQNLTVKLL